MAQEVLEASGPEDGADTRVQIGAVPMPPDRKVWCTVDVVPDVGYWVAVNYAEP